MKKGMIGFIILMSVLFIRLDTSAMEIETRVVNGVSFEEYIVDHIQKRGTQINVLSYDIGREECVDLYRKVLYKHPELYYVSGNCAYIPLIDYTFDSSTGWNQVVEEEVVEYILLEYLDYGQTDDQWVFERMDKPLAFIDEGMTDVEKVLLIHDYMCINLMYAERNTDVPEYHNIMGYILEGKTVCEGYAKAFQYYMNKLGIPSHIVLGDVEGESHAWNEVQIDGQWYMVDVTYDDPTPDEYGRVQHTYLLKSEGKMGNRTWDRDGYQPCTSTIYDDAFWNDVETQMLYRNGRWYYINGNDEEDMNLYCYDFEKNTLTDKGDVYFSLTEKWWTSEARQSYWIGSYGKIAQYKDALIYTTPTRIFQCSMDGKKTECIVRETTKGQAIYGMRIAGDQLLYQLAQSPEHEKQEIMISLEQLPLSIGTIVNDSASKSSYEVVYSDFLGGAVVYRRNLARSATTIMVPESINVEGRDYYVVGIAKKAFVNSEKLSNVRLPSVLIEKMNTQKRRRYLIKSKEVTYDITRY